MATILNNALAVATGLSLALGLAAVPAIAQVTTSDGFGNSGDVSNNEVFSGSGVNLTDIMGNLRRADGLSFDEFNRKSDRNIDNAAADFRRRQQEVIQQDQGAAVEAPNVEGPI